MAGSSMRFSLARLLIAFSMSALLAYAWREMQWTIAIPFTVFATSCISLAVCTQERMALRVACITAAWLCVVGRDSHLAAPLIAFALHAESNDVTFWAGTVTLAVGSMLLLAIACVAVQSAASHVAECVGLVLLFGGWCILRMTWMEMGWMRHYSVAFLCLLAVCSALAIGALVQRLARPTQNQE
jgi:hypothetical protein